MELGPGLDQPPLRPRDLTGDQVDRIHPEDSRMVLIERVKVWGMVRRAGLGEHPDHDAEQPADFGTGGLSNARAPAVEWPVNRVVSCQQSIASEWSAETACREMCQVEDRSMNRRTTAKGVSRKGGPVRVRRRASLDAAQRIAANFAYLAAVVALRGETSRVTRMKTFRGPLPGIYRNGG